MINDLVIIVISHQRANGYNTAKEIARITKYPLITVVDDRDKQLADYLNSPHYPCVEVFSKELEYLGADPMDNFMEMSTALYARLATRRIAREKGYRYVAMFDDDITSMDIRYPQNGVLKTCKINFKDGENADKFDSIIEAMCGFLQETPMSAVACGHQSRAVCSKTGYGKSVIVPAMVGAYVLRVDTATEFRGTQCEDGHFLVSSWLCGEPVYSLNRIQLHVPARGSNDGGIEYKNFYIANWYSLMAWPSCHTLTRKGTLRGNHNATFPKLISSNYQKL